LGEFQQLITHPQDNDLPWIIGKPFFVFFHCH